MQTCDIEHEGVKRMKGTKTDDCNSQQQRGHHVCTRRRQHRVDSLVENRHTGSECVGVAQ
jgi:hypothetical protein